MLTHKNLGNAKNNFECIKNFWCLKKYLKNFGSHLGILDTCTCTVHWMHEIFILFDGTEIKVNEREREGRRERGGTEGGRGREGGKEREGEGRREREEQREGGRDGRREREGLTEGGRESEFIILFIILILGWIRC